MKRRDLLVSALIILFSAGPLVASACTPKAVDCRVEWAALAREGGCNLPRDDAGARDAP